MKTTVAIQNLKCGGCESTIARKIHKLPGIKDISINVATRTISFSYETHDGLETVQKELTKLKYPTKGDYNPIVAKAKSYMNCSIGKVNM